MPEFISINLKGFAPGSGDRNRFIFQLRIIDRKILASRASAIDGDLPFFPVQIPPHREHAACSAMNQSARNFSLLKQTKSRIECISLADRTEVDFHPFGKK